MSTLCSAPHASTVCRPRPIIFMHYEFYRSRSLSLLSNRQSIRSCIFQQTKKDPLLSLPVPHSHDLTSSRHVPWPIVQRYQGPARPRLNHWTLSAGAPEYNPPLNELVLREWPADSINRTRPVVCPFSRTTRVPSPNLGFQTYSKSVKTLDANA